MYKSIIILVCALIMQGCGKEEKPVDFKKFCKVHVPYDFWEAYHCLPNKPHKLPTNKEVLTYL